MEKLSALNLSFDKVLIQIIIPGLIAVFPWFILFLKFHEHARSYLYNNQSVTITIIVLLALIAGMILENLGGRFEVACIEKVLKKENENFSHEWSEFLALKYTTEPIGLRYLRTILLRMKFEISTAIALIPMMIGLVWLDCISEIFIKKIWSIFILLVSPTLVSFYLFFEAFSSASILSKTRKLLVDAEKKTNHADGDSP